MGTLSLYYIWVYDISVYIEIKVYKLIFLESLCNLILVTAAIISEVISFLETRMHNSILLIILMGDYSAKYCKEHCRLEESLDNYGMGGQISYH